MKIKALKDYYDMEQKKQIAKGETYTVTEERAKVILAAGYCEIVKGAKKNDKNRNEG